MAVTEADREEVRRRLRDDYVFYPANALQIVAKNGEKVPFVLKRPQERLARALMAQRDRGEPQRAVILKSRQVGFSTQAQGLVIQRTCQIPNHLAMVVALDGDTTSEIFGIGRFMWASLPSQIQPQLAYERNSDRHKFMDFGEPSLNLRRAGMVGLNSKIRIQTAGTAQMHAKGRGMTIRTLHLSETAFWEATGKRLALLNAVPDDEHTLILEESTAYGHNVFKDAWDAAADGSSGYYPSFTPWFEELGYRRRFANELERGDFEAVLCTGPYGEDEEDLLRLIPEKIREWEAEALTWPEPERFDPALSEEELRTRVLEHLNWRRWAIKAKCEGDLSKFHQEYPSTPDEAFLSTGRKVFDGEQIAKVMKRVLLTDPLVPDVERPGPARGLLRPADTKVVRAERGVTVEVPQKALWVPRSQIKEGETARWRLWSAPQVEMTLPDGTRQPPGQYIVAVDPMSGEENEGELAEHAITVIDHRTLRQVAEYTSRDAPDQVALETLLAALHYNGAMIAVEVTGGWGYPIVARLARTYRYARLFRREIPDKQHVEHSDNRGWSTDTKTKPMLIARGVELLRDHHEIFTSRKLLGQMQTYVYDERGKSKPEPKKLADVLMAWLIAQRVAEMTPIRPDRPKGAVDYAGKGTVTVTRPRRERVKGDVW